MHTHSHHVHVHVNAHKHIKHKCTHTHTHHSLTFVIVLIESFGMTKLHKDIAMKLMESVQDEEYTDQAAIKVRNL